MAAVNICSDFGAQKIKSATVSTISPSICREMMGPDAMNLVFHLYWDNNLFIVYALVQNYTFIFIYLFFNEKWTFIAEASPLWQKMKRN